METDGLGAGDVSSSLKCNQEQFDFIKGLLRRQRAASRGAPKRLRPFRCSQRPVLARARIAAAVAVRFLNPASEEFPQQTERKSRLLCKHRKAPRHGNR